MPEKIKSSIPIDIEKIVGPIYLDPKMIDIPLYVNPFIMEPSIRLVAQNELLDIGNIPMLEYSEKFREDKNPFINAYADAIMANYNNRSIEQTQLVDDEIINGDDLVESAVLWLEVINGNLNQLMGLVGVNNYLLGMMGVGSSVGQSEEFIDEIRKIVEGSNAPTVSGYIANTATVGGTALGLTALAKAATAATAAEVAVAAMALYSLIYVVENVVPDTYWSKREEELNKISPYLTPEEYSRRSGYGEWDELDEDEKKEIESKTENYNWFKPGGMYDGASIAPKDLGLPIELASVKAEEDSSFWSKGFTFLSDKNAFDLNPLNNTVDTFASELTPEMKKHYSTNVPNSMQSSVDSQPLVAMSGVKNENTYAEEQSGLSKILTTIIDIFGPELQTVEGAEKHKARNKYTDTSNMYSRNMLNNAYESKTNTNTNESQDLQNSMYNERNYGPQKVEHTYDMPITSTITINSTERVDYEDLLRKLRRDIANDILGLKAVMFNA